MPCNKNSAASVSSSQKPVNIFYVWYSELCRRLNSSPAPVVKPAKPKCQTVLDFVADRLKVEEWSPVINALRHDTSLHVIAIKSRIGSTHQFLHEVDTEEKVRQMKRKCGSLFTAFILKSLLKSLSATVRNTQVLTSLEFDGLPMFAQYLEPLLKALQKNKTLKYLSLSRCPINDIGCQMVCAYVRFSPNIEVLNLSGCGLTAQSGEHLARLIKYQQINRYCESWHNSLRYSDPNVQVMRGIKRITLNGNQFFGDDGLDQILNELDDDLWIKALDMQKCGITENLSVRILDVVQYSQSLEIVDFRFNDQLSISTIEKILGILKQKHLNNKTEFQWCNTTYTLTCTSMLDSVSNYSSVLNPVVHKAKSAPLKNILSRMSVNEKTVRRTKTTENVQNKTKISKCPPSYVGDVEKKVMELNCQLQEEIAKRKQTEKINEELKRTLDEIRSTTSFQVMCQPKDSIKSLISAIESFGPKPNGIVMPAEKDETLLSNKTSKSSGFPKKNGIVKNGFHHENGFKFALNGSTACTLFEKLIAKDSNTDNANKDSDDEESSLLSYFDDQVNNNRREADNTNATDMTVSQISLFKFMETLKNNDADSSVKFKNRPNTSKYYIAAKKRATK